MRVCILSSVHDALDNRVFYREARSLVQAGHQVTLVAAHARDETRDGVAIIGLPRVARWRRPVLWLDLLRIARSIDAEVYHFHDPELLLVTPWLRWRTGAATVYDVHEATADFIKVKDYMPAALRLPLAWTTAWLEPLLARICSGLIFADDEIARDFRRVRRPKLTLFNYPERSFVEAAAEATRTAGPRPPVVLHLGGHERNRGTQQMIEAFALVHARRPDAELRLVGHFMPASLEGELRRQIAELDLESAVTIHGRVPFAAIGDHLTNAAVGWIPWQAVAKNRRNIPTKLFEYMAWGLPVVASDLPSIRPFVQGHGCGRLVTPGDPAEHAAAILELLDGPEEAAAMGRRGQTVVAERYSWDAMAERLSGLYDQLAR